jgi:hypothetical protein
LWKAIHGRLVEGFARLIRQQRLAPLRIIAYPVGGNIALRYAGVYPETVIKPVAIEGIAGDGARVWRPQYRQSDPHLDSGQAGAGRPHPRRHASIEDAYGRMQAENPT